MGFKQQSLETLRQKVDLIDLLGSYIDLKPSGATYKALCPFHDEKSASFMVRRGDTHYHCFGCGAHGDAITFLNQYQSMSFSEAVEFLAQRFGVTLDYEEKGSSQEREVRKELSRAMEEAQTFFHFMLLHTDEGHKALKYLYERGITLSFIERFKIGFAPDDSQLFLQYMSGKKIKESTLLECGLCRSGPRSFFYDRITIPIQSATGSVIGFSARKFKEETFGGKYVNTPETPLFKKSRVLFGLNYSRRRMAKERRALLVEGQLDALRLIEQGLDFAIASQGTAFGEGHVEMLKKLGIEEAYIVFDADQAGLEATYKVGNLLQKEGMTVKVITLPGQSDPDQFLREQGPDMFRDLIYGGQDYLEFLVEYGKRRYRMDSPTEKNRLIQKLIEQIRSWDQPVLVSESLKRLAHLMQVNEETIGIDYVRTTNLYIPQSGNLGKMKQSQEVTPTFECDVLRWLLLSGSDSAPLIPTVEKYLKPDSFRHLACRELFEKWLLGKGKIDLLKLAAEVSEEGQILLTTLPEKKLDWDKRDLYFIEALQKLLERNWMEEREKIRLKIQSGTLSDDEAMQWTKRFDEMKNNRPQVALEAVCNT